METLIVDNEDQNESINEHQIVNQNTTIKQHIAAIKEREKELEGYNGKVNKRYENK